MRKNITALLQKGDIKPKERVLLLVANQVSEERDGKSILTEADKHALSEGWTPKDNNEVREYNRFNEGWRLAVFAEMDAHTTFLITKGEHFRKFFMNTQLNFYPFCRDARNLIARLEKIKVVDIKEATEITNKQREQKLKNGFSFDYAVYLLAFETLKDDYKQDLKTLYDEVEYDTEYLDNEEIIADLFNGKDELTKEAKEKIAELVAERSYNEFAKEYQLYHYFADIPIMEIAKKWAKEKGIKPSTKDYEWLEKIKGGLKKKGLTREVLDKAKAEQNLTGEFADEEWLLTEKIKEIIEQYARDNQTTPKEIIKATCLKWLDEGLLVKDYTPIFNSKQKNTFNGDTKHQHDELFKEWLKAKNKARETLKTLADKRELEITGDKTGQDKTITGESLYNFKGDYKFIKEFKKRVDEYEANLGIVYADDDPEHKGDNLDDELLITNKSETGELDITSMFGLTIMQLKRKFEATQFIKETTKNGETILDFNDEGIKTSFKEIRESLISGYAKLLAFEDIFKRLSKTYETDLTGEVKGWRESVGEFIDDHNEALSKATGQTLHGGDDSEGSKEAESWLIKRRGVLKTKDDLFIDKEKITPNKDGLESYYTKFKDALGGDF